MGYFNTNKKLLDDVFEHIKEFTYNLWDDAIVEIAIALGNFKDKVVKCTASKFIFIDLKSHFHSALHYENCEFFLEKNENIEVVQ